MTAELKIGTRAELLARMTSQELTGWAALYEVRAEERDRQRHAVESGDGQVYISGLDDELPSDSEIDGDDAEG